MAHVKDEEEDRTHPWIVSAVLDVFTEFRVYGWGTVSDRIPRFLVAHSEASVFMAIVPLEFSLLDAAEPVPSNKGPQC